MFGKRFQRELDMICDALEDEEGREEFIKYMSPFVENTVKKFISDNNLPNVMYEELLPAGWTYLDKDLKNYNERAEMMTERKNDLYYFSTYFAWYIKHGISEYVKAKYPTQIE